MIISQVDLAIVGGGFAGLACAQATAARGLRTAVLDKRAGPGAAPSTTGVLVKEVADAWDVPRRLTRKVRGVRLYSPSLRSVDLVRPGYYFLTTDTSAVLRWWAQQAAQVGAQLQYGTAYRGGQRQADHVQLNGCDLTCRFLVGADGASSRVATDFGLGRNRHLLAGVEAEFEGVEGVDEDRLHVFLDSKLAPGYIAWVVPGVGVTQVGLAARKPHPLRLEAFTEKIRGLFDFTWARCVGYRAGLIPVGGPVRPMGTDRVMLIGDAAGLVSPLTAGGIHTAIEYGRAAGLAICDYLLDGGGVPQRTLRRQLPSFAFKRVLRMACDLRPPNRLYDLMLSSAPMRALAQTIFYHHRGLLSYEAWRDLALAWR